MLVGNAFDKCKYTEIPKFGYVYTVCISLKRQTAGKDVSLISEAVPLWKAQQPSAAVNNIGRAKNGVTKTGVRP